MLRPRALIGHQYRSGASNERLMLRDNYGGIQIKKLALFMIQFKKLASVMNPIQEVGPGHKSNSRTWPRVSQIRAPLGCKPISV